EVLDLLTPERQVDQMDLVAAPAETVGEFVERDHPAHRGGAARTDDVDDHDRRAGPDAGASRRLLPERGDPDTMDRILPRPKDPSDPWMVGREQPICLPPDEIVERTA